MSEMDVGDDLYSDFGPELDLAGDGAKAAPWAAVAMPEAAGAAPAGAATTASATLAVPEPPLVTVAVGAADLYSDLFDGEGGGGDILLKTQVAELTDRVQRQEAQIASLQHQVETLMQQKGELGERCATLASNISSLYNTAKLELQRKDAEIREQRERLAAAGSGRGRPPVPVVPERPSSTQQQAAVPAGGGREQGIGKPPAQREQQQQQEQQESPRERHEERQHGRPDKTGCGSSSKEHSQPAGGSRSRAFSQDAGGSRRVEHQRRPGEARDGDERHDSGKPLAHHDRGSGRDGSRREDDRHRDSRSGHASSRREEPSDRHRSEHRSGGSGRDVRDRL